MTVESVGSIEPDDERGGLYLVRSRGSLHVFDLDAGAYLRLPGERSNVFLHDVSVLRLTRVERWPRVGDTFFIWVDSPSEYALWDYWRQSSPIAAVYRVRSIGPGGVPGGTAGERGHDRTAAPTPDVPTPDVPTPDVPSPDVPTPDVPSSDVPALAPMVGHVADSLDPLEAAASTPGPGAPRPGPGPAEVLPGMEVAVTGVWRMTQSGDSPLDARGSRLRPVPELEWTLTQDRDWRTLLVVYRAEVGDLMQAHLEVRRAAGASGIRSTSALTSLRLVVPEQPPWPEHRSDLPARPDSGPLGGST